MSNMKLPSWYSELKNDLENMSLELTKKLTGWHGPDFTLKPEAAPNSGKVETEAIQAAIDRVSQAGGGTVLIENGDYITGTLVMKDNVRLKIGEGARLLASTDLNDFPEHQAKRFTVQDAHMGMNQALIFAETCENISLCGPGEIDGRGTQDNFPGGETQHGTPGRPFLIRFVDCKGVHVTGVTLRDAACWMENYFNCDEVLLENITVRNQANYNNDGIDIDGCRDVIVRNCDVMSGDDALCFKGASERNLDRVLVENCSLYSSCNALKVGTDTQGDFRNVLVRNCRIGGVAEDERGIKHPCSDSGVSLEMVDGGTLENFCITNIDIQRAWSPLFMRLEDRGRVKPGDPKPNPGNLRRVIIEHVTGCDNGPRGSFFIGVPEKSIEDVIVHDLHIAQLPSVKPVLKEESIGDLKGIYPDAHMIDDLGDAPAYGLWMRHIKNLILSDYKVTPAGNDPRPEYAFANAQKLTIG